MTTDTDTYVMWALGASVLILVILALSIWRAARAYHTYHDRLGAVSLAVNLVAWVIAVGLLLSSLGLHFHVPVLNLAGVSLARGALLVLALVLLVAEVQGRDRLIGRRR